MYVVFESGIPEVEDEMATELVISAGVQVENIICGAFHSVNLHQFVTSVLPMNNIHRLVDLMLNLTTKCLDLSIQLYPVELGEVNECVW